MREFSINVKSRRHSKIDVSFVDADVVGAQFVNSTFSEISADKIRDCLAALIALLPEFDELGRVAYHHQ